MGDTRLSVVTVTWNTGPHLMDAVKAVVSAPGVDELVLVNHDNPPDVVAELRDLAACDPKFKLVETGANLGFSKGCNRGAEAASGDLLLFLNPDAILDPDVPERLKKSAAELNGHEWVIGARILNEDGSEQRGGRRGELTPASAAISFLGVDRFLPTERRVHWSGDELPDSLIQVPTVSGAAMMTRRDVFFGQGGFDERYFLHVEDIDFCRQIRNSGGEVWFEPRASILHYGGTSKSSPLKVETHKGVGFVKFFWKFYRGPVERLATILLTPPIMLALWSRVLFIWLRNNLRGLRHRHRVMSRLRRIKRARTQAAE